MIARAWLVGLMSAVLALSAPLAVARSVVVVIGDSLSADYGMTEQQGWVHQLGERMADAGIAHRVVNASISGDTSNGGRARLGILLQRLPIRVAIIELGGNDGLRGIDLKQTRKHLSDMIVRLQAADAKVLLVGMQIHQILAPVIPPRFKLCIRTWRPSTASRWCRFC